MNFDTKYLIRWGIPGWMLLFILMAYFMIIDFDLMKSIIFNKNSPVIVALISLFIGFGIILGNLLHQVSLCLGFVLWTKRYKFFKKEYEMDLKIIKNQYGKEFQRIYSYRLGNVHALRTLWFSLTFGLLILFIFSFTIGYSSKIGIVILTVLFFNIIVLINLTYFQRNLDYFIDKVKSDF